MYPTDLQTAAWLSQDPILFAASAAVVFLQPLPLLCVVCSAPPPEPSGQDPSHAVSPSSP